MKISANLVNEAVSLDLYGLCKVLTKSGYNTDPWELEDCEFVGITGSGNAMYRVTFEGEEIDEDGDPIMDEGTVFVWEENNTLVAEF